MRHGSLCAFSALACFATASAQDTSSRYALSIYSAAANNGDALFEAADADATVSGGYAVVRDRRQFDLKAGSNTIQISDVARYLDASALSARAVDNSDAVIVSQRFDDQTLSFDALVQRQIGHPVEIVGNTSSPASAPITGTLLSSVGGLTVQLADGRVTTVTDYGRVTFPDLPKGMSATPSLRWEVSAKLPGMRTFEIVYPTQGIAWRAEYSGWIGSGGDCKLSLGGWAQIANRSGTDYRSAQIKLIAGTPNRIAQAQPRVIALAKAAPARANSAVDSGTVGDYHEYSVDAPLDIADNSLQRVALFPEQPVTCQRQYLFEATRFRANPAMAPITDRSYGGADAPPVRSTLAFRIDRALPAGRVRLLENSSAGAPEFIGEDQIGHTPKGEPVALQLGDAFDLRGERRQTDYQINKDQHTLSESFALRLINAGTAVKNVLVREHLYRWTQWNIVQSSVKYEKKNSDTVEFKFDVPANGETSLIYTVQYQWTESYK
jgi:hypothetical protein